MKTVNETVDVLISGGGTAGHIAALAVQKGIASREVNAKDIVALTVEHGAVPI